MFAETGHRSLCCGKERKRWGGVGRGGGGRKGVFMSILEGTISVRLFIAVFPLCGFVPSELGLLTEVLRNP